MSEWKKVKLGDLFERVTRKNTNLESDNVLTISAQYGLINQEEFFNKPVAGKNLKNYYLLKKGEFAYNKSYSAGYPMGATKMLEKYDEGVVSTLYICFRSKSDLVNKEFFKYYFESKEYYDELSKIAQEGARNHGLLNVNTKDFFNMNIKIPSIKEQEIIVKLLRNIDNIIKIINKEIDLIVKERNELISNFLADKERTTELEKCIELVVDNRGKTPPVLKEGIPLIEIAAIGNKNINYNKIEKFVSTKTYNEWFRKHLKKGDVLFSTVGNTAVCSYYNEKTISCIAQNLIGLRFKKEYDSLFMYYMLTEKNNNRYIKSIQMEAVQPSIKVSQFVKLKFYIPELKVQKKISKVLSLIDDKIETFEKKVTYYNIIKKALMQKLLTGKVRVKI